jgi:hypothetical protein
MSNELEHGQHYSAPGRLSGAEKFDLAFRCNPDLLAFPRFLELKQYWDAKRGARRMPTRADIDPIELRKHLGWIELVDVLPDRSDFRYRLLGTGITEGYGRDNTGKTVTEVYGKDDANYAATLIGQYRSVVEHCTAVHGFGSLGIVGKPYRYHDALSLPLGGDDGSVRMIISVLQIR